MSAGPESTETRSMLARLFSWVRPSRSSTTAVLLVVTIFVLATWFCWKRWGPQIRSQPHFQLSADRIHVTPPRPEWIHTDIKAAAIESGKLAGLSLPDRQLVDKVRGAFLLQNWVSDVSRVTKHATGVDVVLVYRRPVAMVEVVQGKPGLWPIDADAVCLPPKDFDETDIGNFLRIVADNRSPAGPVGTYWGDERIRGGARIATLLSSLPWKQLGLYRIRTRASGGRREGPYQYDLETRDQFLIRWGFPPGQEADNEAPASTKLVHLQDFAREHGGLQGDELKGSELDLTDPQQARLVKRSDVRLAP